MGWVDTFKYCALQKYDNFTGRAGRREFWQFIAITWLLDVFTYYLSDARFLNLLSQSIISLVLGAVVIFLWLPSMSVTVRRLHDVNKRGINLCWQFLPLFGHLYLLYLCVQKSDAKDNRFGPANQIEPLAVDKVLLDKVRIKNGISSYLTIFQMGLTSKIFDYTSRANRQEYWKFNAVFLFFGVMILYVYWLLITVLMAFVMLAGDGSMQYIRSFDNTLEMIVVVYVVISALCLFIATLAHLSVAVRRLHDQDLSGAYLLLAFLPIINIFFIWFMMRIGTMGENQYGSDTLAWDEVRPVI